MIPFNQTGAIADQRLPFEPPQRPQNFPEPGSLCTAKTPAHREPNPAQESSGEKGEVWRGRRTPFGGVLFPLQTSPISPELSSAGFRSQCVAGRWYELDTEDRGRLAAKPGCGKFLDVWGDFAVWLLWGRWDSGAHARAGILPIAPPHPSPYGDTFPTQREGRLPFRGAV